MSAVSNQVANFATCSPPIPDLRQSQKKSGGTEAQPLKDDHMQAVQEMKGAGNVRALAARVLQPDPDGVRKEEAVKAMAWIKEKVAAAQAGPITEITMLTPGLAAALLARNDMNRRISETNLERIKRDMESRNWDFNGATIVVAKDGMLNDGQHRCRAVIETNIPIKIVIVFGLERESRMTLDQGVARTVGNFLSMHGLSNVNVLASTATYVWQWRRFRRVSRSPEMRPTKTEVRLLAEGDAQIGESANFCDIKGARVLTSPSMLAFAHYAYRDAANVLEADRFIRMLISGENMRQGDPILYCRNRLIETRGRSDIESRAELLFRAWNAHRRDERVDRLAISGKSLPKLEA